MNETIQNESISFHTSSQSLSSSQHGENNNGDSKKKQHLYDQKPNFCNADDECDVPELIAEDSMMEARTLRLDTLESNTHPARVMPMSSSLFSSAASTSTKTLFSAPLIQDLNLAAPPPSLKQPSSASAPTSCLKKSSSPAANADAAPALKSTKTSRTPRRVRGLWSDDNIIIINPSDNPNQKNFQKKKKHPNIFSQLQDETMLHCLSFLGGEPMDLLAVSQVGRRFHSLVTTSLPLWKTIDATNFVQHMYNVHKKSSEKTSKALGNLLLQYPPETLIIRNIGNKLRADESFLPSSDGRRLKNLTLTHFADLTDTHVHVLLLLLALPSKQNIVKKKKKPTGGGGSLHQLALEYCPKLTNATVRSIASSPSCVELQSLSLQGDSGISDVLPLAKLLPIKPGTSPPVLRPAAATNPLASLFGGPSPSKPKPAAPPSIGSLFAPPPKRASAPAVPMASLFAPPAKPTRAAPLGSLFAPPSKPTMAELRSPPASPPADRSIALHALFAPPGSSPPRQTTDTMPDITKLPPITTATRLTSSDSSSSRQPLMLSRNTSSSNNNNKMDGGALSKIDIRSTNVAPKVWLDCCHEAAFTSNGRLAIQSLAMDGTHWTNETLQDFTSLVSLKDLRSLHMRNSQITDLDPLEGATRLRSLHLHSNDDDEDGTDVATTKSPSTPIT